jgi:hypothetical protein
MKGVLNLISFVVYQKSLKTVFFILQPSSTHHFTHVLFLTTTKRIKINNLFMPLEER